MPQVKHPELQGKFENALRELFAETEKVSSNDILDKLRESYVHFDMTQDEVIDLKKNWANYITRAKSNEVIQSQGTGRGYMIVNSESEENGAAPDTETKALGGARRDFWESLLHLPATLLLSHRFKSRVLSLPQKTAKIKWANPDMLMIRNRLGNEPGSEPIPLCCG